jgi:hypothetical protein
VGEIVQRLTKNLTRAGATFALAAGMTAGAAQVAGASSNGTPAHHPKARHHLLNIASVTGTVTAVGTSSFTLKTAHGASKTIDTTASTTYTEPGTHITPTGVTVGERVVVHLSSSSSATTLIAASVVIELDKVSGTVESVSSSIIVVEDAQGLWHTVLVSATTTYLEGSTSITEADVMPGDSITAYGTPDPSDLHDLDAVTVDVRPAPAQLRVYKHMPPEIKGVVTAVGTGSFTVQPASGTAVVVDTTASTTYHEPGTHVTPTSVTVGEDVLVRLVPGAAVPTATTVVIELDHISGTVESVSGTTITIVEDDGLLIDVVVSATTTYRQSGVTTTEAAVTPGVEVSVTGMPSSTDPYDFDAVSITIGTPRPVALNKFHVRAQVQGHGQGKDQNQSSTLATSRGSHSSQTTTGGMASHANAGSGTYGGAATDSGLTTTTVSGTKTDVGAPGVNTGSGNGSTGNASPPSTGNDPVQAPTSVTGGPTGGSNVSSESGPSGTHAPTNGGAAGESNGNGRTSGGGGGTPSGGGGDATGGAGSGTPGAPAGGGPSGGGGGGGAHQ